MSKVVRIDEKSAAILEKHRKRLESSRPGAKVTTAGALRELLAVFDAEQDQP